MNWTVLGGSGAIGRSLVSYLVSAGEDVFVPDRKLEDIYDKPLGHVINAIGLTADFRKKPFQTVDAHVVLLMEFLQRAKFDSFLYLSSTRVYSRATEGRVDSQLPVLPQDASDLYNLSKLMGEALCLQDSRPGVRVARLSNVVGCGDIDSDNFVATLSREARDGCINLMTSLQSTKDYIHINDVVELLTKIATSGRERLYNVASGIQLTNSQIVYHLNYLTGCKINVASTANEIKFIPVDIRLLREEFDYKPRPVLPVLGNYLF